MSYFNEKDQILEVITVLCDETAWKGVWNSSNVSNDGSSFDSGALSLSATVSVAAASAPGKPYLSSNYVISTLTAYSEQPNIVRGAAKELVTPLMDCVDHLIEEILALSSTTADAPTEDGDGDGDGSDAVDRRKQADDKQLHVHVLCKLLYVICKVAGYKHVMKHLPHEVHHLERCYRFLGRQRRDDFDQWETRYMLILWLAILSLIPFDLCSMDSTLATRTAKEGGVGAGAGDGDVGGCVDIVTVATATTTSSATAAGVRSSSLVRGIIELEISYLRDSGPIRTISGVALSCILTRPDMEHSDLLSDFVIFCCTRFETASADPRGIINGHTEASLEFAGLLYTIVQILKRGSRVHLLRYVDTILSQITAIANCTAATGSETETETAAGVETGDKGGIAGGEEAEEEEEVEIKSTVTRKLLCKCMQRLGMTLLIPRLASWRYARGQRTLMLNPSDQAVTAAAPTTKPADAEVELCDAGENLAADQTARQYYSIVADIVDFLLQSLQDSDTVVRWSAAKGLGRIAMRLPMLMGNDVVLAVIEETFRRNCTLQSVDGVVSVKSADNDYAWHGGCLVLAEFARRGLILPVAVGRGAELPGAQSHLALVIPYINHAMKFDLVRGTHSIGAHVRDAACYVCWAIARAYSPEILRPFIVELTHAMLLTTCYDRELNCRRAASAALQEHVGRQGVTNFHNGIDIITIADYFALGDRQASYATIAPAIVALDLHICVPNDEADSPTVNLTYWRCFLEHLVHCKLRHWDPEIRSLAALGIGQLIQLLGGTNGGESWSGCRFYDVDIRTELIAVLHKLVEWSSKTAGTTVYQRHGALLALTEVLRVIYTCMPAVHHCAADGEEVLPPALVQALLGVVPTLERNRGYRGRGNEIMREASMNLVGALAASNLPFGATPASSMGPAMTAVKLHTALLDSINENLRQPHEKVQLAASAALTAFLFAYSAAGDVANPRAVITAEKVFKATVGVYCASICAVVNANVTNKNSRIYAHCADNMSVAGGGGASAVLARDADTVAVKRGYALALGAVPLNLLRHGGRGGLLATLSKDVPNTPPETDPLAQLLFLLAQAAGVGNTVCTGGEPDAELRKYLVQSACRVTEAAEASMDLSIDEPGAVTRPHVSQLVKLFTLACTDYSVDKRGDTGSWSRVAAIKGICKLVLACNRSTRALPEDGLTARSDGLHSHCRVNWPPLAAHTAFPQHSLLPEGAIVNTVYGVGVVAKDLRRLAPKADGGVTTTVAATATGVVQVEFPAHSAGQEVARQLRSLFTGSSAPGTGPGAGPGDANVLSLVVSHNMCLLALPAADTTSDDVLDELSYYPPAAAAVAVAVANTASHHQHPNDTASTPLLTEPLMQALVKTLLKQMAEKLDSVRDVAGSSLEYLISSHNPRVHMIPERIILERSLAQVRRACAASVGVGGRVMGAEGDDDTTTTTTTTAVTDPDTDSLTARLPWNQPNVTYSFLVGLLEESECFFTPIFVGLTTAVGGLTESVMRESSAQLLRWCAAMLKHRNYYALSKVHCSVLYMFTEYARQDALVLPLLKTVELLLRNHVFDYISETSFDDEDLDSDAKVTGDMKPAGIEDDESSSAASFFLELANAVRGEAKQCNNVTKLKVAVDIWVLLLGAVPPSRFMTPGSSPAAVRYFTVMRLCLKSLVALLGQQYPKVRKYAAEQLYLQSVCHPYSVCSDTGSSHSQSADEVASVAYPGFVSVASDLDLATAALLETEWAAVSYSANLNPSGSNSKSVSAGSKTNSETCRAARDVISRLMRFTTAAALTAAASKREAAAAAAAARAETEAAGLGGAVADESDSYESLVRDAGY